MSNEMKHEEKKLIHQLFWRSFALEGSFNYEKMQALGFAWAMFPAIKLYCKTPQEQVEALKRHTAFFNITPNICTFSLGMAASMEKEYAQKKDMDPATINAVKVSLMGPLSGIGDSFFWGTLRIIAAGIGLSLAQQGSVLGAILFLIIFNVPHLLIRYYGTVLGYQFGAGLMSNSKSAGILKMISKGASIVGLMVIGAMSASMVAMKTPLTFTIGETAFELQGYLDQIFPLLLPLLYTLAMFGLLKKGCKSTTILLITIAVGVIGSLLHIL